MKQSMSFESKPIPPSLHDYIEIWLYYNVCKSSKTKYLEAEVSDSYVIFHFLLFTSEFVVPLVSTRIGETLRTFFINETIPLFIVSIK